MAAKDIVQVASVLTNFSTFGDKTLQLYSTPSSKGSSHINYKNKNANVISINSNCMFLFPLNSFNFG